MNLTDSQRKMLLACADGKVRQLYAPNASTLRALRDRGLLQCRFVGMRHWEVVITRAGLGESRASRDGSE